MKLFCTSERNNTHILLPVPSHRASVLSAVYKITGNERKQQKQLLGHFLLNLFSYKFLYLKIIFKRLFWGFFCPHLIKLLLIYYVFSTFRNCSPAIFQIKKIFSWQMANIKNYYCNLPLYHQFNLPQSKPLNQC